MSIQKDSPFSRTFAPILPSAHLMMSESFEFVPLKSLSINLFTKPVGAFLVLGIILAIINHRNNLKNDKEKYELKMKKLNEMKTAMDKTNNTNVKRA